MTITREAGLYTPTLAKSKGEFVQKLLVEPTNGQMEQRIQHRIFSVRGWQEGLQHTLIPFTEFLTDTLVAELPISACN